MVEQRLQESVRGLCVEGTRHLPRHTRHGCHEPPPASECGYLQFDDGPFCHEQVDPCGSHLSVGPDRHAAHFRDVLVLEDQHKPRGQPDVQRHEACALRFGLQPAGYRSYCPEIDVENDALWEPEAVARLRLGSSLVANVRSGSDSHLLLDSFGQRRSRRLGPRKRLRIKLQPEHLSTGLLSARDLDARRRTGSHGEEAYVLLSAFGDVPKGGQ